MSTGSPESTEDDADVAVLADAVASANRARRGGLVVAFEGGKPRSAKIAGLGDFDAVTIGRSGSALTEGTESSEHVCRLHLTLDDKRVSAVHAHMRRLPEGWTIEDAGSKNGTRLNGKPITRALLAQGDVIEAGRTFLVFCADTPRIPAVSPVPPGFVTVAGQLAAQLGKLTVLSRSVLAILVQGETGSGKELIARAVHELSGRRGPLSAINCGALPQSLVESELFGHRRGAFSGATADRPGLIRSADHGTLFLDEIGDLCLESQTRLLRVLQEGEVLSLGADKPMTVDVRVVAATHRDLTAMVRRGSFRADLLARLAGFVVTLPPLRDRREDLGTLVRTLVERHDPARADRVQFSPDAIRSLFDYHWPANIRELEKVLQAALLLCPGETIGCEHLRDSMASPARKDTAHAPSGAAPDRREALVEALTRHCGKVNAVAEEMRTSRSQIHRLCERFGIALEDYRRGK